MQNFKRIIVFILAVSVVFTALFSSMPVYATNQKITVKIAEKKLSSKKKSYKVSGGYLLPAKLAARAMGAKVTYNKSKKTITIKKGKTRLVYRLNTKKVTVNKKLKKTAVKTVIKNKIPYVDGKHLAKNLGYSNVIYNKSKKLLTIKKAKIVPQQDNSLDTNITVAPQPTDFTAINNVESTGSPNPSVTLAPLNPTVTPNTTLHTPIDESKYYQYNILSETDKTIYSRIVDAINNTENMIDIRDLNFSVSDTDKISQIISQVIADHPHWFWVTRYKTFLYTPKDSQLTHIILLYTDGTVVDTLDSNYQITTKADRAVIANRISKFNEKINSILQTISPSLSALEKEKLIHDYIADNVKYDHSATGITPTFGAVMPSAYDSYGAVCEGLAVCEGYSKMFQYLCYLVGINSTQVMGTALGGGHMWNTVELDGNWYQIDTTWGDADLTINQVYSYFNLTTEQISLDHTIDETLMPVPSCTSTEYAFTNTFGMEIHDLSNTPLNYQKAIDYAYKLNSKFVVIKLNGNKVTTSYISNQFNKSSSTIKKYISSKNYSISFGGANTISDYLYISINR